MAERRLYRSRNAYIAGVCAGLADYFDFDPIVIRILAVFIVGATLGLGAIAYIVLWLKVPVEPQQPAPYEITPQSAQSRTYGIVDCSKGLASSDARLADNGASEARVSIPARVSVVVALGLLFFVVATRVAPIANGTQWWQFWPIAFIIFGVCLIVIPIRTRHEAAWHALGVAIASFAAALLPMSLGVVSFATLHVGAMRLWFLLVAALVCALVGWMRNSSPLLVAASFCIAAFCFCCVYFFALPGDVPSIVFFMPDGRSIIMYGPNGSL